MRSMAFSFIWPESPSGRQGVTLALGFLVLAALGCSSADKPIKVQGKVTFLGTPVEEGSIQFSDAKTGKGSETKLNSDGTYQTILPSGQYAVIILPALVEAPMKNKDTPPDIVFKKVKNIPSKYQSTVNSGLTADIARDNAIHNFDLKP